MQATTRHVSVGSVYHLLTVWPGNSSAKSTDLDSSSLRPDKQLSDVLLLHADRRGFRLSACGMGCEPHRDRPWTLYDGNKGFESLCDESLISIFNNS